MFYYQTGEEVMIGDQIRYPEFGEGFVSKIFIPYTEDAIAWNLSEGAIMLGFGSDDVVLALDKPHEEEDLEFISRIKNNETLDGKGGIH